MNSLTEFFRRLESNKLTYLPYGCLDNNSQLTAVKLDKNQWHCDCDIKYLLT